MSQRVIFEASRIAHCNTTLWTGRVPGRDLILAGSAGDLASLGLGDGERLGEHTAFPAHYDNMLVWERLLAPERRPAPLNHNGHSRGFGAGNRMVVSWHDLSDLTDLNTFAGWDGILAGMLRSAAPFHVPHISRLARTPLPRDDALWLGAVARCARMGYSGTPSGDALGTITGSLDPIEERPGGDHASAGHPG